MYVGKDFDPAQTDESEPYSFDFSNDLAEGETVSSAVWTCEVVRGTDANASSRLSGSPSYSDNEDGVQTITSHVVAGLLEGVTYRLTAVATTSLGYDRALHADVTCERGV